MKYMVVVLFALGGFPTIAVAGPNPYVTISIDLITDGGTGNQIDDGIRSGVVSGRNTIAVEVFANGVTTTLVGVQIIFDFDTSMLKLEKVENSAFLFAVPEPTGINFAATRSVTLPRSGFIGRAEFSAVEDLTDKEFYIGIKSVTLAESSRSYDVITPELKGEKSTINFNAGPVPPIPTIPAPVDSTAFFKDKVNELEGRIVRLKFGDLNEDGVINVQDFLIFTSNFGKTF